MKNIFYKKFALYFGVSLLIQAALIGVFKLTLSSQLHELFLRFFDGAAFNVYDVFYAQISTTFILISIISLLSTNTQKIYWDDMMHRKLIRPTILNFTSLTAYLLASLLISTVFFAMGSNYILFSFAFSLVVMSVFTVKMVGAYFGRDAVKKEMAEEFQKMELYEQSEYRRIMMESAMSAIDNNEMSVLLENMELLLPDIAMDEDDIDIYTNAIMSKIISERNTYALFCVLNQNKSNWAISNAPFRQYFFNMHAWHGGYYYQKVLLEEYFKQDVMKCKTGDATIGMQIALNNCLEIMYVESSKEYGMEHVLEVFNMFKNWTNQLDSKHLLTTENTTENAIFVNGIGIAEFLMSEEEGYGGIYVLWNIIDQHKRTNNKNENSIDVLVHLYAYVVCVLKQNIRKEKIDELKDYLRFILQLS